MVGGSDAKAIWLGAAAAVAAFLSFIYLWREWTIIVVIVAAIFLMGGFMPSTRGGTFAQAIYGGFVIGIVCAAGWLMLAWRLDEP